MACNSPLWEHLKTFLKFPISEVTVTASERSSLLFSDDFHLTQDIDDHAIGSTRAPSIVSEGEKAARKRKRRACPREHVHQTLDAQNLTSLSRGPTNKVAGILSQNARTKLRFLHVNFGKKKRLESTYEQRH